MSSVPNILVMQESDNNDDLTQCEFQHFVTCCCICFSTDFVSAGARMALSEKGLNMRIFFRCGCLLAGNCMLVSYSCQMFITEPKNIKKQELEGFLLLYKLAFHVK